MKIASWWKLRYPLHVHIGVIFIVLIAAVGVLLAGFSYRQINALIEDSTDELFNEIADDVVTILRHEYSPIIKTVELLGYAGISEARDLDERMLQLPVLAQALVNQPHTTGLGIGYKDGDYLAFRPTNQDALRATFDAPAEAHYVVDHLSRAGDKGASQLRIFLDQQLSILETRDLGIASYDPRERPWFINTRSTRETTLTKPYLFYFMEELGITMSRKSRAHETVIAADVTLKGLSETLANRKVSPSAISLLYDNDGIIYAFNNGRGGSLFLAGTEATVPTTENLNNSIIETLEARRDTQESVPFTRHGVSWYGDIREIVVGDNLTLNLLVAAPKHELFSTALDFRRTTLLMTLLVVLITLPIAWLLANQIARPLQRLSSDARAIADFDFSQLSDTDSLVLEIHRLSRSMNFMKSAIENFLNLITSLSAESDVNRMLQSVTRETMTASEADAALIYLLSDDEDELVAHSANLSSQEELDLGHLPALEISDQRHALTQCYLQQEAGAFPVRRGETRSLFLSPILDSLNVDSLDLLALPLQNRSGEPTGILCLVYTGEDELRVNEITNQHRLGFTRALSGFAAVSMESRELIRRQKALLQSFIELLASAIDAKSPYTGGHCQRVPQLAKMLAQAACDSKDERFADYALNDEQWEELHIAAWLHDCGKVTTPEYVVDKSTKLETIYDRIHEVRMRFEVLKRDLEIEYWQAVAGGADPAEQQASMKQALNQLDDDFAFIARCNVGGEMMSDEQLTRLREIATRTWRRTLDDRIGISWEEGQRKEQTDAPELPVDEALIADKPEHLFARADGDLFGPGNPHQFKMDVPELLYNRGELYNLSVRKGTLTEEERFKINEHMVQTITMLNQLPYPSHLRNVPEIAGGHHETMDGLGYPKRLKKDEMSLTARMMAIADIFEALTAADRPYKKPKTLSESVRIMDRMRRNQHIDPDLFDLFLRSGVYRQYGEAFLDPAQLDQVDVEAFLESA